MIRDLDHFHDPSIGGQSGEHHAVFGQCFSEIVVYFVAVTVPFRDLGGAVKTAGFGIRIQYSGVRAKTKRSADVFNSFLIRHQINYRMGGSGI